MCFFPKAFNSRIKVGNSALGTTVSSSIVYPTNFTASAALRLSFHSLSFCVVSSAKYISPISYCVNNSPMASISRINTSWSLPSTSIIRCAAVSSVIGTAVSSTILLTIRKASISINSRALGVKPALKMALTASPACSRLRKGTSINKSCVGSGISLRTILVTIPKVPSLPTNNCVRLYPVTFLITLEPVHIISPVGKTTSRFNT